MATIARILFFLFLAALAYGQHRRLLITQRSSVSIPTDGDIYGIPSLVFWVRAGDLTYSDTGTTPAVDGAHVQQWRSKTNGYIASQGTAARRPKYLATYGTNNTPTIWFNEVSNHFFTVATGVAWAQSNTVFGVMLISNRTDMFFIDSTNDPGRVAIYSGTGDRYSFYFGGPGSYPNPAQDWVEGTWNWYEFVCKSVNGAVVVYPGATRIEMNGNTAGTDAINGITIGERQDLASSTAFSGFISEIMIFNGAFSSANRMTVSNYFFYRYNL